MAQAGFNPGRGVSFGIQQGLAFAENLRKLRRERRQDTNLNTFLNQFDGHDTIDPAEVARQGLLTPGLSMDAYKQFSDIAKTQATLANNTEVARIRAGAGALKSSVDALGFPSATDFGGAPATVTQSSTGVTPQAAAGVAPAAVRQVNIAPNPTPAPAPDAQRPRFDTNGQEVTPPPQATGSGFGLQDVMSLITPPFSSEGLARALDTRNAPANNAAVPPGNASVRPGFGLQDAINVLSAPFSSQGLAPTTRNAPANNAAVPLGNASVRPGSNAALRQQPTATVSQGFVPPVAEPSGAAAGQEQFTTPVDPFPSFRLNPDGMSQPPPLDQQQAPAVAPDVQGIFTNTQTRATNLARGANPFKYTTDQVKGVVAAAADKVGLPRSVAASVASNESSFNPNAVSGANGVGVFQIVPASNTAAAEIFYPNNDYTSPVVVFGSDPRFREFSNSPDYTPFYRLPASVQRDAVVNSVGGAAYYKALLDRGYDLATAAGIYHSGTPDPAKWGPATRAYSAKVVRDAQNAA